MGLEQPQKIVLAESGTSCNLLCRQLLTQILFHKLHRDPYTFPCAVVFFFHWFRLTVVPAEKKQKLLYRTLDPRIPKGIPVVKLVYHLFK